MKAHFETFAHYNAWANHRLYESVAQVADAQYREDRGAFFGSLHGTLNHILVGDRAWLHRITGDGTAPTNLDQVLYNEFESLRQARITEDERIVRVVSGLDAAQLASTITYHSLTGGCFEQPLVQVLAHVFNHQTHHRGQAHTLLSQLGFEAPALDLAYFLRD